MEEVSIEEVSLRCRKNESRYLLRKCFQNNIFSFVPFEIWRDLIVSNVDLKTIVVLSTTCWGFKEIVDDLGGKNFNLALMFRKEGQIVLAKKFLFKCAENNNLTAMLHIGFAHWSGGGWGIDGDNVSQDHDKLGLEWFQKSAERGNGHAMGFCAYCCKNGEGIAQSDELCQVWGKKAIASEVPFAAGFCLTNGFGTEKDAKEAVSYFERSANEGDEFSQSMMGYIFENGDGLEVNYSDALFWYLKSAEHGFAMSQFYTASMYRYGRGVEVNNKLAISWLRKSAAQGQKQSKKDLMVMLEQEGNKQLVLEERGQISLKKE